MTFFHAAFSRSGRSRSDQINWYSAFIGVGMNSGAELHQ
jgi:hypothetical protein